MGKPNNMILIIILLASVMMFVFQQTSKHPRCKDDIECVSIKQDSPIRIGLIRPKAKDGAESDETLKIVQMAISAQGDGLFGHSILLNDKQIDCSALEGQNAVEDFISESQMLGIISTVCPKANLTAARSASTAGLVMVSGTDSSPTPISDNPKPMEFTPGYFRTIYNLAESGRAAANFALRKLGRAKAVVLHNNTEISKIYADSFMVVFEELGGAVILKSVLSSDASNITAISKTITETGADILFLTAPDDFNRKLLKQIKSDPDTTGLDVICGMEFLTDDFINPILSDAKGVYFIEIDNFQTGLVYDLLLSNYKAEFGGKPSAPYFAHVYDAARLLLTAAKETSTPRQKGSLTLGRRKLRDNLYQTVNFQGATGALTCDAKGDCGVARFRILRLDDPSSGLEGVRNNPVFIYSAN